MVASVITLATPCIRCTLMKWGTELSLIRWSEVSWASGVGVPPDVTMQYLNLS